jgi:Ca2+-binding RTX toxin-like protein
MDVVVTVGGVTESIPFSTGPALTLANQIAAAINAEDGTKTDVISVSGSTTPASTYDSFFINATGATTVFANTSASVIGGSGGIAFVGANSTTDYVAIAGGNNSVFFGVGSTENVATGDGNDLIYMNGSGTANAGGGTNTIETGGGNDNISSNGHGDLIVAGSGNDTINESGTSAFVLAGSGADIIEDGGIADTVFGASGAATIFGGSLGVYYLSTASNLVLTSNAKNGSDTIVGATNGSETIFGGTSDLIFTNSSTLFYQAGVNGSASISGGAGNNNIFGSAGANIQFVGTQGTGNLVQGSGNETLSAAGSEVGSTFEVTGGSGSALLVGGNGNDQFLFESSPQGHDTIENFVASDTGYLGGYSSTQSANVLANQTHANGNTTITLTNGSTLTFIGTTQLYLTSADTFSAACFLRGTLIATARGDVAVETLRQGDKIRTAAGLAPVVWIGRRRIDLRRAPEAAPVRIHAGALGPHIPARDLLVSPGHCMFLGGHLIPAERLLNGRTITQDTARREIEYLHIELPAHAILFAEGAATESWLDTGNRAMFENAAVADLLFNQSRETNPDHAWAENGCAPMITQGPILDAVRDSIDANAYPDDDAPEFTITASGPTNFTIPAGVSAIWLTSNTRRVGADPRRLGAAISAWSLNGATLPLDHPRLSFGFYATETTQDSAWRWSNGRSRIEVGHSDHPRTLNITVHALQLPLAA